MFSSKIFVILNILKIINCFEHCNPETLHICVGRDQFKECYYDTNGNLVPSNNGQIYTCTKSTTYSKSDYICYSFAKNTNEICGPPPPPCVLEGNFPILNRCTSFYACISTGYNYMQYISECEHGYEFNTRYRRCMPHQEYQYYNGRNYYNNCNNTTPQFYQQQSYYYYNKQPSYYYPVQQQYYPSQQSNKRYDTTTIKPTTQINFSTEKIFNDFDLTIRSQLNLNELCKSKSDVIRDPNNCQNFYNCNTKLLQKCPFGFNFDYLNKICTSDITVCTKAVSK